MLGITFDSLVQGDATAVLPIDGCTNWAEGRGFESRCFQLCWTVFFMLLYITKEGLVWLCVSMTYSS